MVQLVGYDNFVRSNPQTDRFEFQAFHHVEFLCGDAQTTASRWAAALGLDTVARSIVGTGNTRFSSHILQSGDVRFIFTAPTSSADAVDCRFPTVSLSPSAMQSYIGAHGLAVFAVGVRVADARAAFEIAVQHGARPHSEPRSTADAPDFVSSEVLLHAHGDAVLRFVSGLDGIAGGGCVLPGYESVSNSASGDPGRYGFTRMDHIVSNVPKLLEAVEYVMQATGFHEFAEFTAEDVGTALSGLNSMVLASNNELVLMPFNEPTSGGKRRSQIQTFLDQHGGPGVQHIALKTDNIFETVARMRDSFDHGAGGFELMERPRAQYYKQLRERLGEDSISEAHARDCERLGILADRDDQGVLLQIFTKPVGDRATFFLEIIQRIGCDEGGTVEQKGGCGGFGKGNFHELFRAIEEFETRAGINGIGGA